ncbi:SprT protein [Ectothiorhodospira magna]|uniref:SprT protein n=1 Tax=Ectothiorhodospira magna TaxID=867345 RepID=A0A1H9D837_9GAMM|nr:SprT-like domain-containing protein [Ectothiorhodospira magna]SEQ09023.1 SprT protein [Ectothiorhodospira magna]
MPLTPEQQQAIQNKARELYARAARLYRLENTPPQVRIDLRGRAAGQWRVVVGQESLRFNPHIFALDWRNHFPDTIAHEVAHSVIYRRFGLGAGRRRPHGPEWQEVMIQLGFEPRVTHNTDLSLIPVRQTRTYSYRCHCRVYALGARRHRNAQQGERVYYCRHCGDKLQFDPDADGTRPQKKSA